MKITFNILKGTINQAYVIYSHSFPIWLYMAEQQ